MDKDTFNRLGILEQVAYYNERLISGGSSISSISVEIGMGDSTVRKRFKANGYILNNTRDRYISIDDYSMQEVILPKASIDADGENSNTKGIPAETLKKIIDLSTKYDDIMNLLDDSKGMPKGIIIDLPNADTVRTTMKLNEEILFRFNNFCGNNGAYKKQDLISMALSEYISNHSK